MCGGSFLLALYHFLPIGQHDLGCDGRMLMCGYVRPWTVRDEEIVMNDQVLVIKRLTIMLVLHRLITCF